MEEVLEMDDWVEVREEVRVEEGNDRSVLAEERDSEGIERNGSRGSFPREEEFEGGGNGREGGEVDDEVVHLREVEETVDSRGCSRLKVEGEQERSVSA